MDEGEIGPRAVHADEDAGMAHAARVGARAEDQDIAFLKVGKVAQHLAAVLGLRGHRTAQLVAEFVENILGEARAVEDLRSVAGMSVGLAEVLARLFNDAVRQLRGRYADAVSGR